jgi:hypothetical protein
MLAATRGELSVLRRVDAGGIACATHDPDAGRTDPATRGRSSLPLARMPGVQAPYRPEEEGRFALPHGECGLDLITLLGRLRYREQRSAPEIQRLLQERGLQVCERTVEHLIHRYEELVALHLSCRQRLQERLLSQGRAILARDGLQPDVGHEVLWVVVSELRTQKLIRVRGCCLSLGDCLYRLF